MGQNTLIFTTSPNRANIRFRVIKSSKNDQLSYLAWLVDMIKEKTCQLQRQYYFSFHNAQCCKGVWFPAGRLTGYFLCAEKPKIPENRLVGICHSLTLPKYRSRVLYSLKDTVGQVHIVIATSALSMGVNFPDVRYVIHIGPARSVIDHIQWAGPAGRDGS